MSDRVANPGNPTTGVGRQPILGAHRQPTPQVQATGTQGTNAVANVAPQMQMPPSQQLPLGGVLLRTSTGPQTPNQPQVQLLHALTLPETGGNPPPSPSMPPSGSLRTAPRGMQPPQRPLGTFSPPKHSTGRPLPAFRTSVQLPPQGSWAAARPLHAPGAQPSVAMGSNLQNDAACMKLMERCGNNWKKVKEEHLADPATMKGLIAFRKRTVDGILKALDAQSGGKLVAKSVGSDNLTSDYDITLGSTDGSGIEIPAVVSFNDEIKRMFGVAPGICFDTNLYVKDFLDVTDKILDSSGEPRRDPEAMAAVETLLAEDRSDQDVAALTKQRQYMSADEWLGYKDQVLQGLEGIKDPAEREAAVRENRTQFEEAESTYAMNAADKVQRFFGLLDRTNVNAAGIPAKAQEEMSHLRAEWQELREAASDVRSAARVPRLADEILALSHEHFDSVALEANNEAYMERMSAVRDLQGQHKLEQTRLDAKVRLANPALMEVVDGLSAKLKQAQAARDSAAVRTIEADLKQPRKDADALGRGLDETLANRIDALKARAKKETAEANFFASEAYLSEGPLQHIVNGKQAGNPEVFAKLKPEHFLGSINEQFGDFMKDVGHYAGNEGEGFCQTSKYLHRLLEGIVLLTNRPEFKDAKFHTITKQEAASMVADIEAKLLPIRGAKGEYAKMSDEERFAAALKLAPDVYGADSMAELAKMITGITADVNAVVRAALSASGGGMRPSKGEMTSYMTGSRPEEAAV